MKETLLDIFRPSVTKVLLTLVLAAGAHYLVVLDVARNAAKTQLSGAREFWGEGWVAALPFLETDSKVLKFITFFVLSYVVVWLFSRILRVFDNAQVGLVRKLRKNT